MRIAIIPARGGSVRIPRKNIRLFHGKPIIAYSIEAAMKSGLFDHVYVSTEDDEIGSVACGLGANLIWRDDELARDEVGTQEVMSNVLRELQGYAVNTPIHYACCIYPCAPLLRPSDLVDGFMTLTSPLGMRLYTYVPGIYYWGRANAFVGDISLSLGSEMRFPEERYIDINTLEDWQRAEEMYVALTRRNGYMGLLQIGADLYRKYVRSPTNEEK